MVLCEPIGLRVSGIHSAVRREKEKKIFIEKEREMYWLGFTTRVCGVCKGVQVHVYGKGLTVVV
jgi:hypothetical protein